MSQLRENSEQANHLVMQAMNQLNLLRNHADMAASRFQQAEGDMKASEDTLRLFIDLHPDDPRIKEVSGKSIVINNHTLIELMFLIVYLYVHFPELLPQPMVNKAAFSLLEEIRYDIYCNNQHKSCVTLHTALSHRFHILQCDMSSIDPSLLYLDKASTYLVEIHQGFAKFH